MSVQKVTNISGVGPASAGLLAEKGFGSVEAIARASAGDLAKVQGFGEARAAKVIAAAQSQLAATNKPASGTGRKKDKKSKDKKKKDKKDKKKKKRAKKGKKKKDKKGRKKGGKKKRKR